MVSVRLTKMLQEGNQESQVAEVPPGLDNKEITVDLVLCSKTYGDL